MAEDLKTKTVTGVIWTGLRKLASAMLSFISTIVLARLLSPEDYGYIGMLAIFLAIASTFIDGGFGSALIQKQRPTHEDYSTIFYWNLGLSIVLYLILFFSAPIIASFYKLPLLCSILRVQGIVLIINAVRIVQTNQLRKQLRFKKIAIVDLSVAAFSLAVTIFLAWKGFGVWALVGQQLLVSFLTTAIYWITGHWLPLLTFSKKSFKELFGFGGYVLLSNIVNQISDNIQGLLIGKFYTPATLGYYSKARSTEILSSTVISSVMDQVSYPVLSEAQNDKQYMVRMIKKFTLVLAYITFPLMFLLMLTAKPVFVLLYSEKWLPSVPYFQLLCIGGVAICMQGINYYAVAALGKSRAVFRWTIVKRFVGLVFVVAGLAIWGIYGLLAGSIVTAWIIYIINAALVSKYLKYTLWQQFKDLMPVIIVSVSAMLLGYLVTFTGISGLYFTGIVQALVFVVTYIGLSFLFKLDAMEQTKDTAFIFINKLKNV